MTHRSDRPLHKYLRVEISVRPKGERVVIEVRLQEEPFKLREGPQSDFSMTRGLMEDISLKESPSLTLVSFGGGIRGRDVTV